MESTNITSDETTAVITAEDALAGTSATAMPIEAIAAEATASTAATMSTTSSVAVTEAGKTVGRNAIILSIASTIAVTIIGVICSVLQHFNVTFTPDGSLTEMLTLGIYGGGVFLDKWLKKNVNIDASGLVGF